MLIPFGNSNLLREYMNNALQSKLKSIIPNGAFDFHFCLYLKCFLGIIVEDLETSSSAFQTCYILGHRKRTNNEDNGGIIFIIGSNASYATIWKLYENGGQMT